MLSPLSSNRETKFSLYAALVSFVSVEQSVKCSLCDDAGQVPFEFKSGDEILTLCSTCIVRFSGAVSKELSL